MRGERPPDRSHPGALNGHFRRLPADAPKRANVRNASLTRRWALPGLRRCPQIGQSIHALSRASPWKPTPGKKSIRHLTNRAYHRVVRTREISRTSETSEGADIGRRGARRFGERKGRTFRPIIVEVSAAFSGCRGGPSRVRRTSGIAHEANGGRTACGDRNRKGPRIVGRS